MPPLYLIIYNAHLVLGVSVHKYRNCLKISPPEYMPIQILAQRNILPLKYRPMEVNITNKLL